MENYLTQQYMIFQTAPDIPSYSTQSYDVITEIYTPYYIISEALLHAVQNMMDRRDFRLVLVCGLL